MEGGEFARDADGRGGGFPGHRRARRAHVFVQRAPDVVVQGRDRGHRIAVHQWIKTNVRWHSKHNCP
jgi:hypothetical protein